MKYGHGKSQKSEQFVYLPDHNHPPRQASAPKIISTQDAGRPKGNRPKHIGKMGVTKKPATKRLKPRTAIAHMKRRK